MTMSNTTGYLYVPNWERFQHYKDRAPAWIKLHLSLEGNDAWLDLNPSDRCLLLSIWMVVARYGNGRVRRDDGWLRARAKTPKGSVDRLIQAGLVEVRASTVPPPDRSPEKEGEVEKEKRTNETVEEGREQHAHTTHAPNGSTNGELVELPRRLAALLDPDVVAELKPAQRDLVVRAWDTNDYEFRHNLRSVEEADKPVAMLVTVAQRIVA